MKILMEGMHTLGIFASRSGLAGRDRLGGPGGPGGPGQAGRSALGFVVRRLILASGFWQLGQR